MIWVLPLQPPAV